MMSEELTKQAEPKIKKAFEVLHHQLQGIRTGRAHPSLLDNITVEYYGSQVPLNQVANITVEDARTLCISVWEKSMAPTVEKAILKSNLGLNPASAGTAIRVPLPPLTEERRKDMMKLVKSHAEHARVSIRQVRKDLNQTVKDLHKNKEINEDEARNHQDNIQAFIDQTIASVDKVIASKEKELMEI